MDEDMMDEVIREQVSGERRYDKNPPWHEQVATLQSEKLRLQDEVDATRDWLNRKLEDEKRLLGQMAELLQKVQRLESDVLRYKEVAENRESLVQSAIDECDRAIAERDAARAQVARLRGKLSAASVLTHVEMCDQHEYGEQCCLSCREIQSVLAETPAQALNRVKAERLREVGK